jgi:AcrR family transcriptional regulator
LSNEFASRTNPAESREGRQEARRQAIHRAAVEAFHEHGYWATTADEIALRAEVTKRTLYRYIQSKENLLVEIHDQFMDLGLERAMAVVADGGRPVVLLRRLIEVHVEIVTQQTQAIQVFMEESKHLSPQHRTRIQQKRDAYERIFREVISDGIAAGVFRPSDVRVTTLALLGGITEIYRWYTTAEDMTSGDIVELVLACYLTGIRSH